jgi:hypothetical protein
VSDRAIIVPKTVATTVDTMAIVRLVSIGSVMSDRLQIVT